MMTITIAGNIGKDAETRRTQSGDTVTGFSVAVAGIGRDAPSTWFDVSMFGQRGEKLAPFLLKGGFVAVSGPFSKREHDGRTYLQVRADTVTLGPKRDGNRKPEDDGMYGRGAGGSAGTLDDEIPF